jgi:CRP-like cAMP-binding protein
MPQAVVLLGMAFVSRASGFFGRGAAMVPQAALQRVMATKQKPISEPRAFLANAGNGRTVSKYAKEQVVFSQGDLADTVFYIQKGKVKLTQLLVSEIQPAFRRRSCGSFGIVRPPRLAHF